MIGWRVGACGVGIAVAFVLLRRLSPADGSPLFLWLVGLACLAYVLAMREVLQKRGPSRAMLHGALVLALLWRVPLAIAPVGRDADVYRYLWDARVQRAGHNPYAVRPSDPELAWIHSPFTRRLNNPDVSSPYPPVAQLVFRGVTGLHESPQAIKVFLVGCEALLVAVLWQWLALRGRDPAWVLAYAWHPLTTIEIARNGHFDVVGVLLVCLSAVALLRSRSTSASVWFALAVGTKLLPLVLVPLYWKRVRVRDAVVAGGVLAACTAPFVWSGLPPAGSIPDIVQRFRFNAPLFEWAESMLGAWATIGLALGAGLATSIVCRRLDVARDPAAWAWPMAVTLAWSPLVYPWYLVWLVPFFTGSGVLPLAAWSLTIVPTYQVWHWAAGGAPWRVPPALLVLEYSVPLIAAAARYRAIVTWVRPRG